jgi:hypothetical protein
VRKHLVLTLGALAAGTGAGLAVAHWGEWVLCEGLAPLERAAAIAVTFERRTGAT